MLRKFVIILFLSLIFSTLVYAENIDECLRVQKVEDTPCQVFSTWKPQNCSLYNATIYNETNAAIQNVTWHNLPTKCVFNFTETVPQTYIYNSSIDTGIIVLEAGDMIGVVLSSIAFMVFFLIMAFVVNATFIKILGYMMVAYQAVILSFLVYANQFGESITGTLKMNFLIVTYVSLAVVLLGLFAMVLKWVRMDEDVDMDKKWVK